MFTRVFKVCLVNLIYYFSELFYVKNNDSWGMNSYICMFFSIPGTNTRFRWCKGYSFFTIFMWEKNTLRTHLNYLGWYEHELLLHVFYFIFIKCLYYRTTLTTRNLPYNIIPCKQANNSAAPPLIQNHAKTWWGLKRHWQKKLTDSQGQCALFWSNGQKTQVFTKKTYLWSTSVPVSGLENNSK